MASKNNGNTAKRAAKRHEKQVKRQRQVAARERAQAPPMLEVMPKQAAVPLQAAVPMRERSADHAWRAAAPRTEINVQAPRRLAESDEQIEHELDAAETELAEQGPEQGARQLLEVWEAFEPEEAASRFERAGMTSRFVDLVADVVVNAELDEWLEDRVLGAGLRSALQTLVEANVADTWLQLRDTCDILDWWLGDRDVVLTRLFEQAASNLGPGRLLSAANLVMSRRDATAAHLGRVRDALVTARPTVPAHMRALFDDSITDLEEDLAMAGTP